MSYKKINITLPALDYAWLESQASERGRSSFLASLLEDHRRRTMEAVAARKAVLTVLQRELGERRKASKIHDIANCIIKGPILTQSEFLDAVAQLSSVDKPTELVIPSILSAHDKNSWNSISSINPSITIREVVIP